MVGFEGEKGGVGGEHVVPRKCATASQSYSFPGSSASSEESGPAISPSLFERVKASLTSLFNPSRPNKPGLEVMSLILYLMLLLLLFPCMNCYYLRNAHM